MMILAKTFAAGAGFCLVMGLTNLFWVFCLLSLLSIIIWAAVRTVRDA
jgi:uncharacterized membrane protein YqjE